MKSVAERMNSLNTSSDYKGGNNVESGKSLDQLARNVLKEYGIVPENISVIQSGAIKTVWKLRTAGKTLCLKRLRQTLDKAQFSVNAQIYVKSSGGLVPGVIPSGKNTPVVEYDGQLFVLYEWIDGRDLNFSDPTDLRLAVQGLARFHIASKGYRPGDSSRISTKLGKWPEQYNSMKNRMLSWKETASGKSSQPGCTGYLKYADPMIGLAESAIDLISGSKYGQLAAEGSKSVVLCHQDYGKGNAIATAKGIYVLDLDGVTFDLPSRDLRKIIGKQAENKGQWHAGTISEILNWYAEVNPLNQDERETLYIDLLYPHWFFGLVKNLFQNEKPLKMSEIERAARLEESKIPIIKALLKKE